MTEISLNIEHCKKGFGFYLTQEENNKGHYISNIVPDSPADKSGLREGDVVLFVDKCDFTNLSFDKAVKKIKKSKKKIQMKVRRNQPQKDDTVSLKFDEHDMEGGLQVECEEGLFQAPPPQKDDRPSLEFDKQEMEEGLQVECEGGLFQAPPQLEEDRASLEFDKQEMEGGLQVECEGELFRAPPQLDDDTASLEFDKQDMQGLQVECEGDLFQAPPPLLLNELEERSTISKEMSESAITARLCQITKRENISYGFTLERSGGNAHILTNVVTNSPADNAGIIEDDILVEVNDINVEMMIHDKVVDLVKESTGPLTVLVVDQAAYDYFTTSEIPIRGSMAEIEHCSNIEPIEEALVRSEKCRNACPKMLKEIIPEPVIIERFPEDILQIRDRLDLKREISVHNYEFTNVSSLVKTISQM